MCEIAIGQAYGADYLVVPGMARVGGRMRIALRLFDTHSEGLKGNGAAEGETAGELGLSLAAATRQTVRALRPKLEVDKEEFLANSKNEEERLEADTRLEKKRKENLLSKSETKIAETNLIVAGTAEATAKREAEQSQREPVARPEVGTPAGSLIPDVLASGVYDPKAKTLGLEIFLAGRTGPFQVRAGVNIAPRVGGRAALIYQTQVGPLDLGLGPRLLVVPLSSGVAWGGGVQAEAAVHLFSIFSLRTGFALEAYKAPTQTVIAPLLTFGLAARL